jgi:hypothetical protein
MLPQSVKESYVSDCYCKYIFFVCIGFFRENLVLIANLLGKIVSSNVVSYFPTNNKKTNSICQSKSGMR